MRTAKPGVHARDHDPNGADPATVVQQIKILGEDEELTVLDGARIIVVDRLLDGTHLIEAEAYVTTASGGGAPTIQIRNVTQAVDMLTTKITIDDLTSYTAATPSVVNQLNDTVAVGDLISIDIDGAGTGAMGLGVVLTYGQRALLAA